ncbi:ABC transporter ATP-binding protein [Acidobacteriota bacterium]
MIKRFFNKIRLLVSVIGPFKKRVLLILCVIIIAGLCEAIGLGLIIPFIGIALGDTDYAINIKAISYFDQLFSQIVPENQRMLGISVFIAAIFLIKNSFLYFSSVLSVHFFNSIRIFWTTNILQQFLHADYDYIISQKRGTLINTLFEETKVASRFIARLLDYILRSVMVLSIYTVMLVTNWRITLLLTLGLSLILGTIWKLSTKFSINSGKRRLALNQVITTEGEQALNGIRQVKLFSLESRVLKSYSKKWNELKWIFVKLGMLQNLPAPLGETLIIICLALVLIYYENFSSTPLIAVLPMIAFLATTSQRLYRSLAHVISGRMTLLSYIPSIKLISTIMNQKQIKRENLSKGVTFHHLTGNIIFKDVEFSYDKSSPLFKNLNLCIQKNKITAIVGRSGSGKSTLVDLLCGLYKGYKGNIFIGDKELKTLKLSSWRKNIGFVSQDTFLFHDTVRENILLGKQEASEDEIKAAAKTAFSHEFIESLPKGYATVLGDRGQKLSGGQRQRITVARALIRSPELFIFDEATSALDSESEKLIQKSIEELSKKKTIIIIAHRISTIKNADIIYVMDSGQIIESGTYEELMNKHGHFRSMVDQQN